jgi:hypothetical protein
MNKAIRGVLLALLFSLLVGFLIGLALRSRLDRRPEYIGHSPQFSPGLYCNTGSARICRVALPRPARRTPGTPARASVARLASAAISGVSRRYLVRNAG